MKLFSKDKSRYPITYELLPPRGLELNRIEVIKKISGKLEAVTVTDNPMATLRASSIAYGRVARDSLGIEVIPNLSCRDRNLLGLQSEVIGAHLLGHRGLFIITGDAPKERESFKGVWEVNSIEFCKVLKGMNEGQALVRGISTELTHAINLSIGGAIVLGRSSELTTYRKKVEAGFDYFITQITFDFEELIAFYAEAECAGNPVKHHVQIGLSPASTLKRLRSIAQMPGIHIPEKVLTRFENTSDFHGEMQCHLLGIADEVKAKLNGYSIGFHVMPMGSDEMGIKLVEELTR